MLTSQINKQHDIGNQQGIALRAWAKINLSLIVFDRRPDGYHDLHTIMGVLNWHDDLHLDFAPQPGIHLTCTGLPCPTGPQNIVFKAAQLLADYAQITPDLQIRLHKRIPLGAGLGGGSSDAASCLLGLNRLWDLHLDTPQLSLLAAQLGSDVPFFLQPPLAVCEGRGELVTPLPHQCQLYILLILPRLNIPTETVYQNYQYHPQLCRQHLRRVHYFLRLGDMDGLLAQGINSLTPVCMNLFAELRELRTRIELLGIRPVFMSGSGSTLYVTSPDHILLNQWAQLLLDHNLAETRIVRFQDPPEPFVEVHREDI